MVKTKKKKNGKYTDAWKRLRKNKLAMAALVVVILIILVAVFADLIVPYSVAITQNGDLKLAGPSREHIFGCDVLGRDLFARIIHGSRISLLIGFGATVITTVFALLVGATAAYIGGKYDEIVMRIVDILISIPTILLSLALCAGLGVGVWQLIIAISVGSFAGFTRVARSAILGVAESDYIEAARDNGFGNFRIITGHILPNAMGVILVQSTMMVATNILSGAMLSFLGLGAPIPIPEWGKIMSEGLPYMRYTSHIVIFPTIFIALTALSINILGDGLRDAFDPRLKGKA